MQIGEKLKKLRHAAGISLSQMAKKTRFPKVSIVGWENGSRCPSFNSLRRLTKALGVSLRVFDKCDAYKKRVPKRRLLVAWDDFILQWNVLCRERVGEGWKEDGQQSDC